MKGVTAPSGQVDKVGGEVERNMHGVSGKFNIKYNKEIIQGSRDLFPAKLSAVTRR